MNRQQEREAYYAQLRAAPADILATMPPMTSMPAGQQATSTPPKPVPSPSHDSSDSTAFNEPARKTLGGRFVDWSVPIFLVVWVAAIIAKVAGVLPVAWWIVLCAPLAPVLTVLSLLLVFSIFVLLLIALLCLRYPFQAVSHFKYQYAVLRNRFIGSFEDWQGCRRMMNPLKAPLSMHWRVFWLRFLQRWFR